jgi:hypothetical protein
VIIFVQALCTLLGTLGDALQLIYTSCGTCAVCALDHSTVDVFTSPSSLRASFAWYVLSVQSPEFQRK